MNNMYALADYGFSTDTVVTSFPEERRQWRVKIENHVTDESQKTRDHVDERVDETIEPHLNVIGEKVDNVQRYLETEVVNSYLKPIKDYLVDEVVNNYLAPIKETVTSTNSYVIGTLTDYVDNVEDYIEGDITQPGRRRTILKQILDRVNALPTSWIYP
ncbi:MAG: hypothetical protein II453_01660 [Alphaproteobacteria bacterium]|nr:hypothetical protein [Alphaproteobacteria bacterium]